MDLLVWLGIAFCVSQSAMFSGLNLAMLGVSRLRLEVESSTGNKHAKNILALRQDSNFLLTTILWGNVGINVLLTLLVDSVLAGISSFLFSTVLITFLGEITPQAYFSRRALKMGGMLSPVIRIYQFILYPVSKPSALMLDWWMGKEGVQYYTEKDLRSLIVKHIDADETDVDRLEGIGALNFLALDDILVSQEGEQIDPESVLALPCKNNRPLVPDFKPESDDPFLQKINASGKKWIIITNLEHEPILVLNAHAFLRAVFMCTSDVKLLSYCHKPIIITNSSIFLGKVLSKFYVHPEDTSDDVIDHDLILVWSDKDKRVITGADILGRLMRGIANRDIIKKL
ncbi:MAG: DUF21 domain-containing protein [Gammaproteobacteria bacterium]|nr:DUF21 domain-containing protein [Gammaproteobacteria bacterium]